MARTLCIPATVLLLAALVLSFLVSISLPSIPSLDITRVTFPDGAALAGIKTISASEIQLRLGIWAPCVYASNGIHVCSSKELGYQVNLGTLLDPQKFVIKSSWTRGLVIHTIATGFIFIAFLTSLFESMIINFAAFLASSFAALITLIAFVIDIALFALVHHLVKDVDVDASTKTAPGFWLTFVSLVLCLVASVTFCFARRRERRSSESTSYPMQTSKRGKFWEKFQGDL